MSTPDVKMNRSAPDHMAWTAAPETKRIGDAMIDLRVDGEFEGYASLFNVEDLAGDIVMPGAFRQSLRERGVRGVKMLWQHDAAQPVGAWLSIVEDHRGLKVKGRLNLASAKAREVLALMRDGAVDGLSIGFRARVARRDAASGTRRLYKLDLWEISLVTFPMLPQARVDAVKRGPLFPGGIVHGGVWANIVRDMRRTASLMR